MSLVKITVPCSICGNGVEIELSAQPRIVNMTSCTAIIFEHPNQVTCPTCNQVVMPLIRGFQGLAIAAVPVPVPEQRNLVIPAGGGMTPRRG
jgi:endogenous inhibitor of DNA gyrase (YacG/DUF329 family)